MYVFVSLCLVFIFLRKPCDIYSLIYFSGFKYLLLIVARSQMQMVIFFRLVTWTNYSLFSFSQHAEQSSTLFIQQVKCSFCIIAVILLVIRAVCVFHLKGSRESILLLLCRSLTCPQPCVPSHMSRKFTKLSILVLHIGGSRI